MAGKRLKPFFSYFGSKWRLAPKYPAPRYDTIVEPFAGSAQYACLYPDRKVYLCDKDPIIAGLWRYLINVSEEEILGLPDLAPGMSVTDIDVPMEARWLIGFCANIAATRPGTVMSPWAGQRAGGQFWGAACRARIANQLKFIRHWRVTTCSYEDLPLDLPATWYVDPPYQIHGKHYRCSASSIDFSALGTWCQSLPGQVIVCENAGAEWLPFRELASVSRHGLKGGIVNKEVVWLSDEHR